MKSRGYGWEENIWWCRKERNKVKQHWKGCKSPERWAINNPWSLKYYDWRRKSLLWAWKLHIHFPFIKSPASMKVGFVPCTFGDIMSNYGQILRNPARKMFDVIGFDTTPKHDGSTFIDRVKVPQNQGQMSWRKKQELYCLKMWFWYDWFWWVTPGHCQRLGEVEGFR